MRITNNSNANHIGFINEILKDTNITVCGKKGIDIEIDQILKDKFVKPYGTFYLYVITEEKEDDILAELKKTTLNERSNMMKTEYSQQLLEAQTISGFQILDMSLSPLSERENRDVNNIVFDVFPFDYDDLHQTWRAGATNQNYANALNYSDAINYINELIDHVFENETSKVVELEEKDM